MKRFLWSIGFSLLALLILPGRPQAEILTLENGFGSVRAWPNPWRSNRDSAHPLTIDGLPASAVSNVRIYTISGELVRTLGGTQSVHWDLCNNSGARVASGIYIYLATANNQQRTGKIAVIR